MIPVRLRQGFIAPHPQQGVLDDDPLSGEGFVVLDIDLWARPAGRFVPWMYRPAVESLTPNR